MSKVYLPLVHGRSAYKGLAMAMPPSTDAALLDVSWRYSWRPRDPFPNSQGQYVPMTWDGKPVMPEGFSGNLLVMNEPNVPHQLNISPSEAAVRVNVLRENYPQARLIGPNHSVFAVNWIREFLTKETFDCYGIHCYIEGWVTVEKAIELMTEQHELTGGTYWITEYGSMRGDLGEFKAVTEWFMEQPWIERIAAYTNRQELGAWWAISSGVELVREDKLTEIGTYYASIVR
jgi:hypothetical protein